MSPYLSASYAIAVLFSQLSHWGWLGSLRSAPFAISTLIETLLSAAAIFVLLAPCARGRLVLLASMMLLNSVYFLPEVPNHRIVLSVMALVLLSQGREDDEQSAWHIQVHYLIIALALYSFAFFHKLNTGFLHIEQSCAAQFLQSTVSDYGLVLPQAPALQLRRFAIYGTLLTEAVLVILLLFRSTRLFAVVLGLVFHLLLSFDLQMHFLDFSAVMTSLLLGFVTLSRETSERLVKVFAPLAAVLFLLLALFGMFQGVSDEGYQRYVYIRQLVWLLYCLSVLTTVIRGASAIQFSVSRSLGRFSVALLFLLLLNGASPYLGLKTRTAFSMYSNLRIDHRSSNHLLIPASLDLFGFLEDQVEIIGPEGKEGIALGSHLPLVTFAYLIDQEPDTRVSFRYRGQVYHYPDQALPEEPSWLAKKLTFFRPGHAAAEALCLW